MTNIERVFQLIDSKFGILYSFIMFGVILVLIGIQNVTKKDLKNYFKQKKHLEKVDRVIAWGIFYIIFGTLLLISASLTASLYIRR